ncbi:MAG TPA: phosphoribosylaminoimidazolesuccinocarboxamide synthase [Hyphomicrobiaceae bacterium]|jgi:phosphoribosylaminoimidazole-succinocarboxamide synthase|nr:phosphoribosylaminoimidazolesuccinocarboxamide synthase [Hyphomicrobiaceae bacterium]
MLIAQTDLPLPKVSQGKVRDVYAVDAERLLLVVTDRVSAFDVVMTEAIPSKGQVLTQLSAWWCRQLDGLVRHHVISTDADEIVRAVPSLAPQREIIDGRATLCWRTVVFPVECVVRGHLAGSAWKEYSERGTLAGERLPRGLVESQALTPPLFSPATKAATGHDQNITVAHLREIVGGEAAAELERLSRAIYERGRALALDRGIIVADAKFEFGSDRNGRVLLIDEVLTPDSSRFWPASGYQPGRPQPSYDKQPLRDYLDAERRAGRWNGEAPAPPLPRELVEATSRRYLDVFRRLTGDDLRIAVV